MQIIAACSLLLLCCVATLVHAYPAFVNPTGGTANSSSPLCYAHWQSIGPFAVQPGSTASAPEGIGAITSIWTANGVAFAGSANGGVWRTMSLSGTASYGGPLWVPMTDTMDCGSITAISGYDNSGTLVVAAACGLASSSRSGSVRAGEMSGVMLTTDGGSTWAMTSFPKGYDVSAIVFSGTTLVVSARGTVSPIDGSTGSTTNSYGTTGAGGIWSSTTNGMTWSRPYSATAVFDLVVNPSNTSVLYAALLSTSDGANAMLTSTDSGVSWHALTSASASALASSIQAVCQTTSSVPILNSRLTMTSVGESTPGTGWIGFVFYLEEAGTGCYGLMWSNDGTTSWSLLNPANFPVGWQASSSSFGTTTEPTGSAVQWYFGASDVQYIYSVDISTWAPISGSGGAASNTAPHVNTLNMAWDAQASKLIAVTEGGIYTRSVVSTNPTASPWTALNGNLAVAQSFSAAFDPESGALAVGTSGNGVMISQLVGTTERNSGIWSFIQPNSSFIDGTSVGIDSSVSPAQIYSAAPRLNGLSKLALRGDVASRVAFSLSFPRTTGGSCATGSGCFAYDTPLAVNSVDNSLVLVCTADINVGTQCFSFTFGNILSAGGSQSVTALELESQRATPSLGTEPLTRYVFGGRKNSISNDKVVFLVGKTAIWARDTPCTPYSCIAACTAGSACPLNTNGNALIQSPPWRTTITCATPAQHPEDYYINLVIDDAGHSWLTKDFGLHWIDLNLDANSNLRVLSGHTTVDTFGTGAALFVHTQVGGVYPLVIATSFGAFVTFNDPTTASFFTFVKLGANYAHTVPTGLFYSPSVDELTLSTFGRGVWQMQSASWVLAQAQMGQSTSTANSACLVPLYPNVVGAPGYTTGATPAPIGFPSSAPVASSTAMAGAESSSAMGMAQSSSASQGTSSAMDASSAAMLESSSAMAQASSAAVMTSSATDQSSSAVAMATSSTGVQSSAAAATSSAMDASSSALHLASSAESFSSSGMDGASSAAAMTDSSTAALVPTDASSSAEAGPPVVVDSSTGDSPVPPPPSVSSSSTGTFLPILVQFSMSLDLFHLPNGVSVLSFTNMLLASLNAVTQVADRFEFVAFGQPNLIVQVRVLEPAGPGGASAQSLATALIALINNPHSSIYTGANADPILKSSIAGSAAQYAVAPEIEQPDSASPFGSINTSNGNSARAGLTIGVIVGCVLVVVAVAACALVHWREKEAYNARKKALFERTQELMSV